ncbi:hypothetical protein F0237_09275 [Vibrio tubiashii]|uniref:Uncharacterized protein n=1 Tax=Vibrio tubiashii TaxID=29498 RepID=A0AAE5LHY2_9VIBR|nr:hypothetical protein [Vibrio tubiashii]NOI80856.1 hypothetical protein [Vibrio tubiashii]
MITQPLLNIAIDSIASRDREQRILAAEILSRFPEQLFHLEPLLLSDDLELISISLESLQYELNTPIQTLLYLLESCNEPEIKLLCIRAIQNNALAIRATDLLIAQLFSKKDYWDGDWNDADDLSLAAAKSLLPMANQLSLEQAKKILSALKQLDIEPDLSTLLIKILAKHNVINLESEYQSKDPSINKQLLTASTDRVLLYKYLRGSNLILSRTAYHRLGELNAREYLQDFLAGMAHVDPQVRETSIQTLLNWQYKIGIDHLEPLLKIDNVCLSGLIPLVDDDVIPWLSKEIRQDRVAARYLPSLVKLMVQAGYQLDTVIDDIYIHFPSLDELQKLDLLDTLNSLEDLDLSTAFLRQCIENTSFSNAVREYFVQHLSLRKGIHHQQYYSQLLLEKLHLDMGNAEEPKVHSQSAEAPFSTLASLSIPSQQTSRRVKKASQIQMISNRSFALQYCSNKELLNEFSQTFNIEELGPHEFGSFINACIRLDLSSEVMLDGGSQRKLLSLLGDNTIWNYASLWNWLGAAWVNHHQEYLLSHQTLAVSESTIPFIVDVNTLKICCSHHYVGIKKKAWERCRELEVITEEELIRAVFEDSDLHQLLPKLEQEQVSKQLLAIGSHDIKLALIRINILTSYITPTFHY